MREPKFRKKSSKKLKSKHFRKKHSTRRTNKLRGGNNQNGGRYGPGFFRDHKKPRDSVANEELYERLLDEPHTENAKTSNSFMDRLKKTMRFFNKNKEKTAKKTFIL